MVENIHFIPVDSDPCNRPLAWARMPMFLWLPDEMSLEYIFSAAHAYVGHERESDFPTWGGSRSLCWADCCLILLLPAEPLGKLGGDTLAGRPQGGSEPLTPLTPTDGCPGRMPPSQFSLPSRMGERPGWERIHHGLVFFFQEVSWASSFSVQGCSWLMACELSLLNTTRHNKQEPC